MERIFGEDSIQRGVAIATKMLRGIKSRHVQRLWGSKQPILRICEEKNKNIQKSVSLE